MSSHGVCYLIGGGPGDLGLVTLRAKELLQQADVIVYDSLINDHLLDWAPPQAEKIYAGKRANKHVMKQADINAMLVEKCRNNKIVVRLKGGDPFIFGRGGEEAEALVHAGLPYEVVPGVTSGIAAPAYAGIPLTHREHSTSVTFVTGHECPKESGETDWAKLAALGGTLVIYMGVKNLPNIAAKLIEHGMSPTLPAAFIQWGCDYRQRSLNATLASLPAAVQAAGLTAPAIIVVGHVAALHEQMPWFSQRPLHGKKILITRTREQNSRLRQLLENQGAHVVEMPLIQISPIPQFEILKQKFPAWIVFTSPNAVRIFLQQLMQHSDLRAFADSKIATIGQATTDECALWHLKPDFSPSLANADTLVHEWPQEAYAQPVLFPCSALADDTIEKGLKEKGCEVQRLEIYQTTPDPSAQEIWHQHQNADWILFCSSSAVDSFNQLHLGSLPAAMQTASIGTKTSDALKRRNLPVHREAAHATLESLVSSLSAKS
ncbi:MAG: uroporphyrinogen-III C-methyltransferase [Blastochloris sp.]|nr:uroporphyrinogen-III C-methyltransferase [Blastochloris sp.]